MSAGAYDSGDSRAGRPKKVVVRYRGIAYELDLAACARALVHREIAGDFDSMEALATAAGVSRSSVSRFFAGRQASLKMTLAILDKLKLGFEDVLRPCDPNGGL